MKLLLFLHELSSVSGLKMKKSICLLLLVILALTVSCFDEAKVETSPYAAITSFRLGYYNVMKNDLSYQRRDTIIEVRQNGSMYPMTIDQVENRIYNRDSLAQGSILNSVTCTIGSYGTVYFMYDDVRDTLMTKWSSDVEIDFTRPLKFYAVSTDKSFVREYGFSLNVHKVNPDSMSWHGTFDPLMSGYIQKAAVCRGDVIYDYFTTPENVPYVIRGNIGSTSWGVPVALEGFPADGWSGTVTLFKGKFHTLAGTTLYSSEDGFTWTPTGVTLSLMFPAGNETGVMWAVDSDGMLVRSTDMQTWFREGEVPAGFPDRSARIFCDTLVTNSNIVRYVLAGIAEEDGTLCPSVWTRLSGDSNWTRQTDAMGGSLELPTLDNLAVFSYDGSLFALGTPLDGFWQSMDHGLTWRFCDRYNDYYTTYNNFMQLPEELKGTDSSVVCTTDSYGGVWIVTGDGQVWRGVINRLNRL